jgi:hypothetical protein
MRLSAKQVKAISKLVNEFQLRSILITQAQGESAIRIYTGKSNKGGPLWYKVAFNGEPVTEIS